MATKQVELAEMSKCTVGDLVETLSNCYISLIKNKVPFKNFPSPMLWSEPGLGKSQAIRQIAEEIEAKTDKKVVVTDVRLLLFSPIDLRGIPVASEDRKTANWLIPTIFQMDRSNKTVNILFLDELSAAPQSVQAAAYQITLDRKIGEHTLPENCIVIAAGNRVTDKSVAFKMPKALANRLLHFQITTDFDSWKNWAIRHDIHPAVVGFLSFRSDYLNTFDASNDSLAFATPRSWEFVSNIMKNVSDDFSKIYGLIAGLIGSGLALEFRSWLKIYHKLPKVTDIFNGKDVGVPHDSSAMYALICSMIQYAKAHKDEINRIVNSIKFSFKFPTDFSVLLIKEYISTDEELTEKLLNIPEFIKLLGDKVNLLNGVSNGLY